MRILEKDYRYLLLNLIPRRRLSLDRRKQIDSAIAGGSPEEIRLASVLALEDLCLQGYFERREAIRQNGQVSVVYARRNGNYHVRVVMPADEWRRASLHGTDEAPPVEETLAGSYAEPPLDIIPDLIKSLSINGNGHSTLERLISVMTLLPEWLHFAAGRLVLVEERLNVHRDSPSPNVRLAAEKNITATRAYERCRYAGRVQYLDGAVAVREGLGPPEGLDAVRGFAGYTVALAPVSPLGEFWGVLDLWTDESVAAEDVRERVELALATVSSVIENVIRLEDLTSIDKLTGVFNRHFYDTQVRIEIERATRSGSDLTMLVVDIDDFKRINDSMGHRKGDEALAMVASLIKNNLRKIDTPFRYGGEEFVVLLPGTAETEAIHTAERLRMVISENRDVTDTEGRPITMTVSIGAAVFPAHARTEAELFSKADTALYRAKSTGKNRVEFHRD